MKELGLAKLVKSKRAWVAFATLMAVMLNEIWGIDLDPAVIVALGAVVVGGYAIEDAAKAREGNDG